MKPPPLFIGLPTYGGIPAGTLSSLLTLIRSNPIPMRFRSRDGDSAVCRARNYLTADFLASDCEKLLFIDSDLIFEPAFVARVASHAEDVVGGFYPIKNDAPHVTWCMNALQGTVPQPDARGLAPVRYIGTGFLCIHRRVFERIIAEKLAPVYRSEYEPRRMEHEFWHMGVRQIGDHEPRYLSEDWWFCQLCLDLGIPIWGDCAIFLKHIGQGIWPLPRQETGLTPVGEVNAAGRVSPSGLASAPPPELVNRIPPSTLETVPHQPAQAEAP